MKVIYEKKLFIHSVFSYSLFLSFSIEGHSHRLNEMNRQKIYHRFPLNMNSQYFSIKYIMILQQTENQQGEQFKRRTQKSFKTVKTVFISPEHPVIIITSEFTANHINKLKDALNAEYLKILMQSSKTKLNKPEGIPTDKFFFVVDNKKGPVKLDGEFLELKKESFCRVNYPNGATVEEVIKKFDEFIGLGKKIENVDEKVENQDEIIECERQNLKMQAEGDYFDKRRCQEKKEIRLKSISVYDEPENQKSKILFVFESQFESEHFLRYIRKFSKYKRSNIIVVKSINQYLRLSYKNGVGDNCLLIGENTAENELYRFYELSKVFLYGNNIKNCSILNKEKDVIKYVAFNSQSMDKILKEEGFLLNNEKQELNEKRTKTKILHWKDSKGKSKKEIQVKNSLPHEELQKDIDKSRQFLHEPFSEQEVAQKSKVKIVDVLEVPQEELLLQTKKEDRPLLSNEIKVSSQAYEKDQKIKKIRKKLNHCEKLQIYSKDNEQYKKLSLNISSLNGVQHSNKKERKVLEKINLPQEMTENVYFSTGDKKWVKMEDKSTQYEQGQRRSKAYSTYSSNARDYKIIKSYEPDLEKYEKIVENGIVIYRPKRNFKYESSITGIMENDEKNRGKKGSKYEYTHQNRNYPNFNRQSLNYSRKKQQPSQLMISSNPFDSQVFKTKNAFNSPSYHQQKQKMRGKMKYSNTPHKNQKQNEVNEYYGKRIVNPAFNQEERRITEKQKGKGGKTHRKHLSLFGNMNENEKKKRPLLKKVITSNFNHELKEESVLYLVEEKLVDSTLEKIEKLPDESDSLYIFSSFFQLQKQVAKGVEIYDIVLVFLNEQSHQKFGFDFENCYFVKEDPSQEQISLENRQVSINDFNKLHKYFSVLSNRSRQSKRKENAISHIYYKDFNKAIHEFTKILSKAFPTSDVRKYFGVQDLPTLLPNYGKQDFAILLIDEVGFHQIEDYSSEQTKNSIKLIKICIPKSLQFIRLCKRQRRSNPVIWLTQKQLEDPHFLIKNIKRYMEDLVRNN